MFNDYWLGFILIVLFLSLLVKEPFISLATVSFNMIPLSLLSIDGELACRWAFFPSKWKEWYWWNSKMSLIKYDINIVPRPLDMDFIFGPFHTKLISSSIFMIINITSKTDSPHLMSGIFWCKSHHNLFLMEYYEYYFSSHYWVCMFIQINTFALWFA